MKPALQKEEVRTLAAELGFDTCRFTRARLEPGHEDNLREFVAAGHHGTMNWLAETAERRASPERMWPQARSAIVLAMNYGPATDPLSTLGIADAATISVYARNRDYHDVIKGRLKTLAARFSSRNQCEVRVFVDTAPLMEKPIAAQAGVGWQGKHTNLVSREFGSWLFLGIILTNAELEPDSPQHDSCGSCRACLDICPTNAFPAPYRIDARRCISYLTIEHKGAIARDLRPLMGNRIYGCDDCLAACPWNKFAIVASEMKLVARADLDAPPLADLASLDDAAFRARFSGSPVKRIGRNRFIRNVLIAIGNSGDNGLSVHALPHLDDDDPIIRGAAIWALSRLLDRPTLVKLAAERCPDESDPDVIGEWQAVLKHTDPDS